MWVLPDIWAFRWLPLFCCWFFSLFCEVIRSLGWIHCVVQRYHAFLAIHVQHWSLDAFYTITLTEKIVQSKTCLEGQTICVCVLDKEHKWISIQLVYVITWFYMQFGINKLSQLYFSKANNLSSLNKCLFIPNCMRLIMLLLINNTLENIPLLR